MTKLWLSLTFPNFPLEVLAAGESPAAVIGGESVIIADAVAMAAGIAPGMRLAAAWARLPQLVVLEHRPDLEAAALNTLACWAGRFTPEVWLIPGRGLVLEVGSCLRLFGGADVLFMQVLDECTTLGFTIRAALAPTPRAALWLAAVVPGTQCLSLTTLRPTLATLPVAVLAETPEVASRIAAFGLDRIGDLMQLPRASLMRRIGAAPLRELAQALGELPDLRPRFIFPERFAETLELPSRIEHAATLLFAAQRLVAALTGWLAARAAGIANCVLWLEHERGNTKSASASRVDLGFAAATRDAERITRVLREHLERLALPAPVLALRLEAMTPETLSGHAGQLFTAATGGTTAAGEIGEIGVLVERLQARLGKGSVLRPEMVAEHRPECSTRLRPWQSFLGGKDTQAPSDARPCWLLPKPEALTDIAGRPQRRGPLHMISGPERIESGWWDAGEAEAVGDIRRDYYVARSQHREWLWIFRTETGWFLHGVFA